MKKMNNLLQKNDYNLSLFTSNVILYDIFYFETIGNICSSIQKLIKLY